MTLPCSVTPSLSGYNWLLSTICDFAGFSFPIKQINQHQCLYVTNHIYLKSTDLGQVFVKERTVVFKYT